MSSADARAGRVLLAVTWLRVVLVPVVMVLIPIGVEREVVALACAALFLIASLTDLVDGYLARRWSRTTTFGSFLDTTADKLLISGPLLTLVAVGRVSDWIAFVIIGRELLVLGLKGVVASGGTTVEASIWGKWKAVVQFLAISTAIAPIVPLPIGDATLDGVAMLIATAFTVGSAIDYLARFRTSLVGQP